MKTASEKYSVIPLIALMIGVTVSLILIYLFGVSDTAGIVIAAPVFIGAATVTEKMFKHENEKQ